MKEVAIIGGGLAGLACANVLVSKGVRHIALFDCFEKPGTGNASSVACGLINPSTSKGGSIWRGIEGYHKTTDLIRECESFSGKRLLLGQNVIRVIFKAAELNAWQEVVALNPSAYELLPPSTWGSILKSDKANQTLHDSLAFVKIKYSDVVDTAGYLSALWQVIQSKCQTASWTQRDVSASSLTKLSQSYDAVVIAAGPGIPALWTAEPTTDSKSKSTLPFRYTAGQSLLVDRNSIPRLVANVPLLSGEYFLPTVTNCDRILFGSTFEHVKVENIPFWRPDTTKTMKLFAVRPFFRNLLSYPPNTASALSRENVDIAEQEASCISELQSLNIIACRGGIRVVPFRCGKGRIPRVAQHSSLENVWLCGGLSSRGLIHHVIVAEELVRAMYHRSENILPNEMKITKSI